MKEEQDYIRDITEIRTMMERSSRFLSLSGGAGIMAGVYALAGVYIASQIFNFKPDEVISGTAQTGNPPADFLKVIILAVIILVLAIGTAIFLSWKKAHDKGEKAWNATSRRLLMSMAIPLTAGGILLLILFSKGMTDLAAPMTMIFYGLALFNASKFTYEVMKSLGIMQVALGLISTYFIEYSLVLWALGFGVLHIIYGIYMHFRYER